MRAVQERGKTQPPDPVKPMLEDKRKDGWYQQRAASQFEVIISLMKCRCWKILFNLNSI